MKFLLLLAIGLVLPQVVPQVASATPWIATRYAQNCAGCHAPSRRNVAPKERRCTLACQGCHVSPSGGGMRNEYGIWNQQRWLRSFKSEYMHSKGMPAPLPYQKYGKMPKRLSRANRKYYSKLAKKGPPLVVVPGTAYDEADYDKSDGQEHINVGSRAEFLGRVTDNDPWRTERTKEWFAAGEFRWFYFDGEITGSGAAPVGDIEGSGPMVFDLSARYKPIPVDNVSFVFEMRNFHNPVKTGTASQGSNEFFFNSSRKARTRSAYVLIDDLPWASYVQYGLYKPMIGHHSPDHSSLLNNILYSDATNANNYSISPNAAYALNKVLTIGASPNVPFFNLHWIQPLDGSAVDNNNPLGGDSGFGLNVGARFVTMGINIMGTYWSTKGPKSAVSSQLQTDIIGLTGGFTYKNAIITADMTNIEKEFGTGSDKGSVTSLELKYRVWREIYLMANHATSNTTRALKEGKASETMVGIKSFLTPGVEFEILQVTRTDRSDESGSVGRADTDMMQGQLHVYF